MGTCKYLGLIEGDKIKQAKKKEKLRKGYLNRTRTLLETKLYGRNLNKGINIWAVPLVRHSGAFLKCTREL